jgi:hypothetical protein
MVLQWLHGHVWAYKFCWISTPEAMAISSISLITSLDRYSHPLASYSASFIHVVFIYLHEIVRLHLSNEFPTLSFSTSSLRLFLFLETHFLQRNLPTSTQKFTPSSTHPLGSLLHMWTNHMIVDISLSCLVLLHLHGEFT